MVQENVQLAQAAAAAQITVTITVNGQTTTQTLTPGQALAIPAGAAVTVDAGGQVLDVGVDGANITFTDPNTGQSYTLSGLADLLTTDSSSLAIIDSTTGNPQNVAIADILQGISTAAGGDGANGGGTGSDGSVDPTDVTGGQANGSTAPRSADLPVGLFLAPATSTAMASTIYSLARRKYSEAMTAAEFLPSLRMPMRAAARPS
jgi:hypothetical protein